MLRKIPQSITCKFDCNLHKKEHHPVAIVKQKVVDYLQTATDGSFTVFEDLPKQVGTFDNFDALRIPTDHPSRSQSDTFYVSDTTVLRTHTSAHQHQLLKAGHKNFIVVGDVYRRDEVNRTHFPVFHQLEGVMQCGNDDPSTLLRNMLTGLVQSLFPSHAYKINDDYFPFVTNGVEVEVEVGTDLLEILGGGTVHTQVLEYAGLQTNEKLIAWGLGLERLAMILFHIPDIRLFWTQDQKFLSQFSSNRISTFVPYSVVEPVDRDISFFVNQVSDSGTWTNLNEFYEVVRDSAGDMIESVVLYDKFFHPKTQKLSHTFRIRYSPVASCTNAADLIACANASMSKLRSEIADMFDIHLR